MISVEITGIKLLPKIREFNDVFQETPESAEPTGPRAHAMLLSQCIRCMQYGLELICGMPSKCRT